MVKKIISPIVGLICIALAAAMLLSLVMSTGSMPIAAADVVNAGIAAKFDQYVNNASAAALEGIVPIKKIYRIDPEQVVAPEPDQSLFKFTDSDAEMAEMLDEAYDLLAGQETFWNADIEIMPDTQIQYYLDDTIMAITWKEVINRAGYTFSEIKIADPSQFRRYLADNTFGSGIQYATSDMATTVNAVVAINGDFYKFRDLGMVVYKSELRRLAGELVDSCGVDGNGDLHFIHKGEILDADAANAFIKDNDIRFSVAFGPILVEDGVDVSPANYVLGEINDIYARSAICQLDELHYLLVTVNTDGPYRNAATTSQLAAELARRGVDKAYTLDGGQTATIVMNDQVINSVEFGFQRNISDIMYFATAIPSK